MIKTRIILNGYEVDLVEDVPMPMTYEIANIRNPQAKNANYSKTITLPGTLNNNKLFGYLFDTNVLVNSSGTTEYGSSFNPNKKASVQVLYDGEEQFNGYLRLDKINVLQNYAVSYDVTMFGKLADLFITVGEKTMAELDLSKYNHRYTRDVQQASWNSYIYKNGVTQAYADGEGYTYPMVDYARNNDTDYKVSDFFPAIFYKTVLREIINQNGFQFDGTIFDNADFKKLVVSYGSGNLQLSQSQVDNRTFRASNTTTQIAYSSGTITTQYLGFNDDTTSPNQDTGGVYNTGTGIFTCSVNGTYKIKFYISASATHYPSTATATLTGNNLGWAVIERNGSNINSTNIAIYPNGGVGGTGNLNIFDATPVTSGATSPTSAGMIEVVTSLTAGDTVRCKFVGAYIPTTNCYGQAPGSTSFTKVNITTDSYFKAEIADPTVNEGDMVDMNNVLPSTIKQKEFLSSFFKMFNVYTEDDRYTENLLHFETRPDFYATSGTTRDFRDKLDLSQKYTIKPMGDLDARTYVYKFKDDGDYWNDYYQKKYGQNYGLKKYDIDNDFLKSVNVTESIFSPTPLVDRIGSDRIIPRIFQINNNGQAVPKTSNLRLWYYGGVKTTNNAWNYIASSGTTSMSTYPYAGHLDNPQSPNYDVNFYLPIEVFYTAQSYTNNNLFNLYYKQFVDEITNKDSKILEGYFHLRPSDISRLNFRDSFFILGDYWRLNKIEDYDATQEGKSTKCEFIKLLGGVPFVPTSGTTNGGGNISLGTDTAPTYMERTSMNYFSQGQLVSGVGNIVDPSATGIIVSGDQNTIGAGARNVSVINSSGTTVAGNVMNVSVINSSNMNIDSRYNGYTVVDGHPINGAKIKIKNSNYKSLATDLGHTIIYTPTINRSHDLPNPGEIGNGWKTQIKNANNSGYTVTVNIVSDFSASPSWATGDGTTATTHVINQGESFWYQYFGGVWYITL